MPADFNPLFIAAWPNASMHALKLPKPKSLKELHTQTLAAALDVLDGAGLPFGAQPYAPGTSERAVEVLYAAKYLQGARDVLDIGLTFASLDYLGLMLSLQHRGVHVQGVDIIPPERVMGRYPAEWRDRVLATPLWLGDMRTLALPVAAFDVCTCISTLEHIGFDEAAPEGSSAFRRGLTPDDAPMHRAADTDKRVLAQIAKTLKPGGHLILTVPAGSGGTVLLRDSMGLYTRQWEYEAESLCALSQHEDFELEDLRVFRETPWGWAQVASITDVSDVTSALKPHAAGCALMLLRKRST